MKCDLGSARRHHGALVLCVLALTACRGTGTVSSEPPRPNVVLFMTDDQGWGDAGFREHPRLRTPHLDAMARAGVRFERWYAAAPVCSPTRGSVLTGRHPARYGILGANSGHLPAEEVTLAEVLLRAGYATGHFGKWHLGVMTTEVLDSNRGGPRGTDHYAPPWEHGFERCFSTEAKVPTFDPMVTPPAEHGGVGNRTPGEPYGTAYWTEAGERVTAGLDGDDSALIVDRALAFIEEAVASHRPFLAVVWLHAPHLPVVADEAHTAPHAGQPLKARHYLGCLSAADEALGRVRSRLEELGVRDDTMLWYTSDNGPEGRPDSGLGSTAGLRGRKRSLYEGGIRVPGVLEWPALGLAGVVLGAPAGTVDYMPTVLAATGLTAPDAVLDGIDLFPLLRGQRASRDSPMGFVHRNKKAWIEDDWKIIRAGEADFELYDLADDPGEEHDLAQFFADRTRAMAQRFARWKAGLDGRAVSGN